MPTKVDAFKCDFCGRLLKTPHTATQHEAACNKNPARRHCITCIHGITACIRTDGDWTDPYGPGTEIHGPYCAYHEKPISEKPYFIECDTRGGFDTGVGWMPETPIPFTCFAYETKGYAKWTPEDEYKENGGAYDGDQADPV